MRRLAGLLLVTALGLVGTGCDPELSRKTSGTFTGTTSFEFTTPRCPFVDTVYDASYVRRQGAEGGRFHIEGCVALTPPLFAFEGEFSLTTQGGAVLRGAVTGTVEGSNAPTFPFHFRLVVQEGTKRFAGATGVIVAEGTWDGQSPGTIRGTLTASLAGPDGAALAL